MPKWPPRWIEISDKDVLDAIARVPRHRFVPAPYQQHAYEDRPLPIGWGQTISQPFIVALMTELLAIQPQAKVLEIGTGCGYQTAILAELADEVYSVELIPELSRQASQTLSELGYSNVHLRVGDGWQGWPQAAPFDGIIVTAAAPIWPPALTAQLAAGGHIVLPIGPIGGDQILWHGVKIGEDFRKRRIGPVRFVPLVNPHDELPL
ncbi:MAG: protein-L-isoaspartate(D-aspartate) O-methyltransferase [Chloroflexi bacterium]|nr:protein-L-isoaspartate(D-aspartate) O-methyltransferase [Chloroflexota bacterium]